MQSCSILVIRGEESMARACLSGIPFVWNAYPQSEEYQLVKVQALLEKMRPYFSKDDFCIIEKFWILFNTKENDVSIEELEFSFFEFLNNLKKDGICETFSFRDKTNGWGLESSYIIKKHNKQKKYLVQKMKMSL